MDLKRQIQLYNPFDAQEKKDKEYFLKCLSTFNDVLTRENELVHFSSSAFVLNKDRTKMLVVYHKIYDSWICPGGHADGEADLLTVAIREVKEETGLEAKVLDDDIFSIQTYPIKGHIKGGKYVSAHTHLDVVYLLEADDTKELTFREDESCGVKWIPLSEATSEDIVDFTISINKKIINKMISKNLCDL